MDTNVITMTGNLTADPEMKYLPSGKPVVNFSIANNRRWKDQRSGEWKEDTTYVGVTAFDRLAENIAESLGKGDKVTISGRLNIESWEKDGERKTKTVINAMDVSASLQRATVAVTRNPREEQGGGHDAPQAAPASNPANDPSGEPF